MGKVTKRKQLPFKGDAEVMEVWEGEKVFRWRRVWEVSSHLTRALSPTRSLAQVPLLQLAVSACAPPSSISPKIVERKRSSVVPLFAFSGHRARTHGAS